MRSAFCSLFLLIGLSAVKAQIWCPPGATWTYGVQAFWLEGYYRLSYVGDTVLAGITGQRLNGESVEYNHLTDSVETHPSLFPSITSSDAEVVGIWSNSEQSWDTLYWLTAVPGQRWGVAHSDSACGPPHWIQVTDTGTLVVDGAPLHYLDLEQVWQGQSTFAIGRVVERLGWLGNMEFWPPCLAVEGPQGLRCYSDGDIDYHSSDWAYGCTSLLSIPEPMKDAPWLFPNPGTDHFTLELPSGAHVVDLFDATGQRVRSERSTTGTVRMNTESLAKGIYLVRVDGTRTARWVKQ